MSPQNKTKLLLPKRQHEARETKIADDHSSMEELKLAGEVKSKSAKLLGIHHGETGKL